jgi:hypothetical protein
MTNTPFFAARLGTQCTGSAEGCQEISEYIPLLKHWSLDCECEVEEGGNGNGGKKRSVKPGGQNPASPENGFLGLGKAASI